MWNKKRTKQIKKDQKWSKKGLYAVIASITVLFLIVVGIAVYVFVTWRSGRERNRVVLPPPLIQESYLAPNEYSRPETELTVVRGVVVHYTANPGTSALANRNYFNNLPKINAKKSKKTYASSHFIIGMEGEIIQCVPLNEIAYASNSRNVDTISIECCHKRKNGKFTQETYHSLVELTAYLCSKYDLTEYDVIRHHDVTGKNCPRYFVEHEEEWKKFLADVGKKLEGG